MIAQLKSPYALVLTGLAIFRVIRHLEVALRSLGLAGLRIVGIYLSEK
jgi:hypothetical protein